MVERDIVKVRGIRLVGCAVLLTSLWGCFSGNTSFQSPEVRSSERSAQKGKGESRGESEHLQPAPDSSAERSSIEILWELPAEPIDGFTVRYGESHEALTTERRLAVSEVEKVEDPVRGKLYRYVIPDIPNSQRLFVSISAFKGETESTPSRVFEVAPGMPERRGGER